MKILYIGDVMGRAGRDTVEAILPELISNESIDFTVAQSENVSHGKSMLPKHMQELQKMGVNFFTGGNHSFERPQLANALEDPSKPVIGPANVGTEYPGVGWKIATTKGTRILVVSLLGSIFPNSIEISNPLNKIDEILEQTKNEGINVRIVNLHGDYSSEKVMMGHYLDGRVDLVVGDHWHVPTADARVLPNGTGYMTDVGMCGALNSSLGVAFDSMIAVWKDGHKSKRVLAEDKPWQFNAVLFDTESKEINHIQKIIDE